MRLLRFSTFMTAWMRISSLLSLVISIACLISIGVVGVTIAAHPHDPHSLIVRAGMFTQVWHMVAVFVYSLCCYRFTYTKYWDWLVQ